MRTVGIIAEYDPFHCGHAYHLQKAREMAGADYVVVAMSPDFLQRGEPALLDKWVRARMALEAGADLVLELPVGCATGSAEYFAQGGVRLLHALGCVDALSFGCEAADAEEDMRLLTEAAHFFAGREPEDYRRILRDRLREGISYPRARALSFAQVLAQGKEDPAEADRITALLGKPNNILALEYQKCALQLGSAIDMIPVRRLGGYHESIPSGQDENAAGHAPGQQSFFSASAIRAALRKNGMAVPGMLREQLPFSSLSLLEEELQEGRYVVSRDLDLLLHQALLKEREHLQEYLDIDEELAGRIRGCLSGYTGFLPFAAMVQSKQYTLSRIRRSLMHVLLGIRKGRPDASCARVLGFRKTAGPLLHQISVSSSIPLSTGLPFSALSMEDVHAAHLWEMILTNKNRRPLRHEQQRKLVIL